MSSASRDGGDADGGDDEHRLILELMSLTARLDSVDAIMALVTERLARHLGVSRCLFTSIDFDAGVTVVGDFAEGLPSLTGVRILTRVHAGSRDRLETARLMVNEDTRTNPRSADDYDAFYGPAGIAALISVPLLRDGAPVGIFTVGSSVPRAWTLREAALVSSVGERAWLLIERQHSVHALRASEARYRRMVETAHEGIWEADAKGITLYANRRMAEILGTTPEAMIGRPSDLFVDEAEMERVKELRAGRKRGVHETFELPLRRRDGTTVWTLISSAPTTSEDGRPIGALGFVTDITDRVDAVTRLRESEARKTLLLEELQTLTVDLERRVTTRTAELAEAHRAISLSESNYRAIIETSPLAMFVAQADKVAYANPSFRTMLGYAAHELVDRDPFELVHPDDHAIVRDRIGRLVEQREGIHTEIRYHHASGAVVWTEAVGVVIEHNGAPAVAVMLRDITAQREADHALKASVREKEVLLKEIHHRVKNNLQIVSSMLYLQSRSVADVGARAHLEQSQARVRSIALVHEQLYRSPDLSRVDFARYTESLVRNLGEVLDAASRGVEVRVAIGIPPLEIDAAIACGLIISELVTNALKHAFPDRAGYIDISATTRDRAVELRVADDGIGLPTGLDPRTSTGLGLDLVYTLAEQIGAIVSVERGQGTCFSIKLGGRHVASA